MGKKIFYIAIVFILILFIHPKINIIDYNHKSKKNNTYYNSSIFLKKITKFKNVEINNINKKILKNNINNGFIKERYKTFGLVLYFPVNKNEVEIVDFIKDYVAIDFNSENKFKLISEIENINIKKKKLIINKIPKKEIYWEDNAINIKETYSTSFEYIDYIEITKYSPFKKIHQKCTKEEEYFEKIPIGNYKYYPCNNFKLIEKEIIRKIKIKEGV
jgi:hypothetical protein